MISHDLIVAAVHLLPCYVNRTGSVCLKAPCPELISAHRSTMLQEHLMLKRGVLQLRIGQAQRVQNLRPLQLKSGQAKARPLHQAGAYAHGLYMKTRGTAVVACPVHRMPVQNACRMTSCALHIDGSGLRNPPVLSVPLGTAICMILTCQCTLQGKPASHTRLHYHTPGISAESITCVFSRSRQHHTVCYGSNTTDLCRCIKQCPRPKHGNFKTVL